MVSETKNRRSTNFVPSPSAVYVLACLVYEVHNCVTMTWIVYDKDHMSELRTKNRSERDLCSL